MARGRNGRPLTACPGRPPSPGPEPANPSLRRRARDCRAGHAGPRQTVPTTGSGARKRPPVPARAPRPEGATGCPAPPRKTAAPFGQGACDIGALGQARAERLGNRNGTGGPAMLSPDLFSRHRCRAEPVRGAGKAQAGKPARIRASAPNTATHRCRHGSPRDNRLAHAGKGGGCSGGGAPGPGARTRDDHGQPRHLAHRGDGPAAVATCGRAAWPVAFGHLAHGAQRSAVRRRCAVHPLAHTPRAGGQAEV